MTDKERLLRELLDEQKETNRLLRQMVSQEPSSDNPVKTISDPVKQPRMRGE